MAISPSAKAHASSAQVTWLAPVVEPSEDGWTPATELQEELEVVDRNIVLGDCVTVITDPLGQVSVCRLGQSRTRH